MDVHCKRNVKKESQRSRKKEKSLTAPPEKQILLKCWWRSLLHFSVLFNQDHSTHIAFMITFQSYSVSFSTWFFCYIVFHQMVNLDSQSQIVDNWVVSRYFWLFWHFRERSSTYIWTHLWLFLQDKFLAGKFLYKWHFYFKGAF